MKAGRRLDAASVLSDARLVGLAAVTALVVFIPGRGVRVAALAIVVVSIPQLLRFRPGIADWSAVAFAALAYASAAWSRVPALSDQIGRDQILAAAMFVALRAAVDNRRAIGAAAVGFVVGCLLLVGLLLVEGDAWLRLTAIGDNAERYTVAGVNQNLVAYTLTSGVAFSILLVSLRRRALPLILAVVGLCSAGVLLTGTRGALVAVAAVVAWWVLVPLRYRRLGLRTMTAAVAAAAFATVTGAADSSLRQMFPPQPGRETGDLNNRLVIWPVARDMLSENPVLGDGAGAVTAQTSLKVFAHTALLDVGSGMGYLGIALLVATLWLTLVPAARGVDPRRMMLVGVAVCAMGPPLLSGYWFQAPPLWVLLAVFSRIPLLWSDEAHSGGPTRELEGRPGVAP